jgi:hypothetical protein
MRWFGPRPQERVRADVSGLAQLTKKALQPREFVSPGAHVRIPHRHGEVVPPQRIANRVAGRVDVDDLPSLQDLADAQRPYAVLVLQPSFALFLVHDDDLLGDPV